jgi:NADPH:quinone reductase-like Zn-dependent oxidoreductase
MRNHLITVLALSTVAVTAHAARINDSDAKVRRDARVPVVREYDPSDPRDNYSRVVKESKRRVVEPDGDRVVITRKIYKEPDGDLLVQELRQPIDR